MKSLFSIGLGEIGTVVSICSAGTVISVASTDCGGVCVCVTVDEGVSISATSSVVGTVASARLTPSGVAVTGIAICKVGVLGVRILKNACAAKVANSPESKKSIVAKITLLCFIVCPPR